MSAGSLCIGLHRGNGSGETATVPIMVNWTLYHVDMVTSFTVTSYDDVTNLSPCVAVERAEESASSSSSYVEIAIGNYGWMACRSMEPSE